MLYVVKKKKYLRLNLVNKKIPLKALIINLLSLNLGMKAVNNTIKLEKVHINLINKHLVENIVLEGEHIEASDLREVKRHNLILTQGERYTVLIVTNDFVGVSKAARELLAGNEIAQNTAAYAFLISNFAQRILGNYYLKVNRPQTPTKLFTERKKAISWLKLQLVQNNS